MNRFLENLSNIEYVETFNIKIESATQTRKERVASLAFISYFQYVVVDVVVSERMFVEDNVCCCLSGPLFQSANYSLGLSLLAGLPVAETHLAA